MTKILPLIRCKGCLCYEVLPNEKSPFHKEAVREFIHAHRYCPKKD